MDSQRPVRAAKPDQDDALHLADSLREDFIRLMAIFDRQMTAASDVAAGERLKISDARAAAERGLRLSEDLRELLAREL